MTGDMFRHIVTQRPTLLLSRELYATPILGGGVIYLILLWLMPQSMSRYWAKAIIFTLRAILIHWKIYMPLRLTLAVRLKP